MSMADPDRQIKRGRRHLEPEIKGGRGGGVSKKFFSALLASFWSATECGHIDKVAIVPV